MVSGRDVVKALSRAGFIVVGRKGSHIRLKKTNERTLIVIVPNHRELARGTFKSILRQANLSREQFNELI